jgi:D-threo-aldose 1-dehydrogenase
MNADTLPRRRLGRSALDVTTVGLGCAPLGELFVRVDDVTADATLQAAWDGGIRYFDTAPQYGFGLSEHRLGRFLRERPRDEYLLSTKVGRVLHAPRDVAKRNRGAWVGGLGFDCRFDYSRDGIMRSVEDSFQRLGLTRVDMLLIHDLDVFTHGSQAAVDAHTRQLLDSGWAALAELRTSGAVGAIGAGLNDAGMMLRLVDDVELDFFLLAMRYTLLEHETLDSVMPRCAENGVGVVVGSVFSSGIAATGAIPGAKYNYAPATPEIMDRVARIDDLCRRYGVTLPAAALQFPLGHSAVAAVIPGAVHPTQVRDNLANAYAPIPADFWSELRQAGLIRPDAPVPTASLGASR